MNEKTSQKIDFIKKCPKCGKEAYIPEIDFCIACGYDHQPSLVLYDSDLLDVGDVKIE